MPRIKRRLERAREIRRFDVKQAWVAVVGKRLVIRKITKRTMSNQKKKIPGLIWYMTAGQRACVTIPAFAYWVKHNNAFQVRGEFEK